jgi:hypothetical protein
VTRRLPSAQPVELRQHHQQLVRGRRDVRGQRRDLVTQCLDGVHVASHPILPVQLSRALEM